MRSTLALLATAALAISAVPVGAETVTVRVGYGDVDVTTAVGRAALEARIEARLKKACALGGTSRYLFGRNAVDSKCLTDARADAKAQVEQVAALDGRGARAVAAN